MKKWAIYTRVSTTEQNSLMQNLSLKMYADKMSYQYDIIEEVESSRKTRPLKQKLLNDLRKKKYEGVIVYKLDRWARSSRELLLEIEELTTKGIKFISYSENLDFTTAIGKLQFNILSAFAEFERDLIRQRTIEGLRRTKTNGTKLGRRKGSKDKKKRKTVGYYNINFELIVLYFCDYFSYLYSMGKIDLRSVKDLERSIIRRDAIKMIKRGDKKSEIASFYGVHVNTVRDWWKHYKKEGVKSLSYKKRGAKSANKKLLKTVARKY